MEIRDGKLYRCQQWPPSVEVAACLLDRAIEGGMRGFSVTGSVAPVLPGSSIMDVTFTSLTFTCENGTATYDFRPQTDDDHKRDVWHGVRRE